MLILCPAILVKVDGISKPMRLWSDEKLILVQFAVMICEFVTSCRLVHQTTTNPWVAIFGHGT